MVDDADRPAAPRVFCPLSFIVLRLPRLQVYAGPRIERIIGAAGKVEEVGHRRQYSRPARNFVAGMRHREEPMKNVQIVILSSVEG